MFLLLFFYTGTRRGISYSNIARRWSVPFPGPDKAVVSCPQLFLIIYLYAPCKSKETRQCAIHVVAGICIYINIHTHTHTYILMFF